MRDHPYSIVTTKVNDDQYAVIRHEAEDSQNEFVVQHSTTRDIWVVFEGREVTAENRIEGAEFSTCADALQALKFDI